jgi:DNA-binding transcriptional ArsR family regulator
MSHEPVYRSINLLLFNPMVEYPLGLDATFGALSHPVRRQMLNVLRGAPMRVTELAAPFSVSLAASSKHIRVLERAGIVTRTVSGRDHLLRLDGQPLRDAGEWIETYRQFWEHRLDALAAHLRGTQE